MHLSCGIEFAPRDAAFRPHRPARWVNCDAPHPTQVNHDAAVTDRGPGHRMPAAVHRKRQTQVARYPHGPGNVGGDGTTDNQGRPSINHAVEHPSRNVVVGMIGVDHLSRNLVAIDPSQLSPPHGLLRNV